MLGGISGTALSATMTRIYKDYFSLPDLYVRFFPSYFFTGVMLSILFCAIAAFQGAKGVLKLQPADAMHPPVPTFNKKSWFEKIPGFWAAFTVQGRMAVRNVLRNKGRSFFTFVGILFTFSMMASLLSLSSMMDIMIMEQFTKVQKYDVKISFAQPISLKESMREIYSLKGIKRVEPLLEVPVTLQYRNRKKDVTALGLMRHSELYTPVDTDGNIVDIAADGLMLSQQVADNLKAKTGDRIKLESIWAKKSPLYIEVSGIIPQYFGANVYMSQQVLLDLLGQGDFASSLIISMEKEFIPGLKEKYKTSQFISSIEEREQTMKKYDELMEIASYTISMMALLAVVTGFAIVYNTSIISLAERKRELASLRVLGMHPKEVLEVISVEQWILGILGIIMGIPLAFVISTGISKSLSTDLFSIPNVTSTAALIQSFFGTVFAIWAAQLWVGRKVRKLDLVDVLKERE